MGTMPVTQLFLVYSWRLLLVRCWFHSSEVHVFFGMNRSTVIFFSKMLNLRLTNLTVTRYYGFAIISMNNVLS